MSSGDHISTGQWSHNVGWSWQALGDLDEAIGPALAMRRKQRDLTGAPYYDATFYSGNNLARLPEALRPKPGRLTNAQQRVYEVQTPFVPISLLQSALQIVYWTTLWYMKMSCKLWLLALSWASGWLIRLRATQKKCAQYQFSRGIGLTVRTLLGCLGKISQANKPQLLLVLHQHPTSQHKQCTECHLVQAPSQMVEEVSHQWRVVESHKLEISQLMN